MKIFQWRNVCIKIYDVFSLLAYLNDYHGLIRLRGYMA